MGSNRQTDSQAEVKPAMGAEQPQLATGTPLNLHDITSSRMLTTNKNVPTLTTIKMVMNG